MTTHLQTPADLLDLVGSPLAASDWVTISQQQVDLFADATGDHQSLHTDPRRAAASPFEGTIAHGYLTLALAPVLISQVLQIRELTAALNYGINTVRFPTPVRVDSQIRATVSVRSARQRIAGVEAVFTLTYEIEARKPRRA